MTADLDPFTAERLLADGGGRGAVGGIVARLRAPALPAETAGEATAVGLFRAHYRRRSLAHRLATGRWSLAAAAVAILLAGAAAAAAAGTLPTGAGEMLVSSLTVGERSPAPPGDPAPGIWRVLEGVGSVRLAADGSVGGAVGVNGWEARVLEGAVEFRRGGETQRWVAVRTPAGVDLRAG